MSIPNSSEQKLGGEDNEILLEVATATAELALVETSSGEVVETNPTEIGQELTSRIIPDVHFLESNQCNNIVHCRDICYTIINNCFGLTRFLESYYRYDDVLAVNNDLSRTLSISDLYCYITKLPTKSKET